MKILHVIDSLNIGGAEKVYLDLVSMLLDAGHQVGCMVISARGPLYDKIDNRAQIIFLGRKSKFNPLTMRRCTLIASRYDIVHVHMRHTWAYVKLSSVLFKKIKGLIFHDHFGDIAINNNVTFRLKGFLKPHCYIGVSKELVDWARASLNLKEGHLHLLKNTIIPKYDCSDLYKGDWVMVSNLRETKNILFAIGLAERMKRQMVIFGNHDGSWYADKVIAAAEASDFGQIVQNEYHVQKYLGNFSLAVHASYSETGPLVLLEYLAHGLPFITYDCGEVVNQIRQELPDFIASSFNEEEWKLKIEFIELEKQINGEKLDQRLKALFAEKFSPKAYIEQCLKIYQNVLAC